MNTAALKALADQCICHPASRGIADIEAAGEGLKHLIAQLEQMTADRDSWAQQASDRVDDAVKFAAQLEDAQGEIRALRDRVKELEHGLFSIVDVFRILKDSDFPALAKCRALLGKTNEQG